MFLTVRDRRRMTLVAILTMVVVPVVIFLTNGKPQAEVAAVAVAGVAIDASTTDTSEPPEPVFLSGPNALSPSGTAAIAYPSEDAAGITGPATFSSFNGAPATVCNSPMAPYGMRLVVKNLNNGRSISCSNVMMPSTPANVSIVLHTQLFVELSDLVNAPIPVSITW